MAFEQTWRWFGPNDPVSLKEIRQTGAKAIVTALHHVPVGEIWAVEEINSRKNIIESEGLNWSVVESLPVHENIKMGKHNFKKLIENYKQSIINLARCGIDTVCYNFMPVLDWSRTQLRVVGADGSITTKFDTHVFAAFDLFILCRPMAANDYSEDIIIKATDFFNKANETEKEELTKTILFGLPGSLQSYSLKEFKDSVLDYNELGENAVRQNLLSFLREIIPVAEEAGVYMTIHPDDPPRSLLGLPRVVGNRGDISKIISEVDSVSNGLTFCSGSFGAGYSNNLVEIAKEFAHRINFVHLRNLVRDSDGDFIETYHLEGEVDLYEIMKILLIEQKRRIHEERKDTRLPMRPDHGHLMIPELDKKGIYPGYSLFGRIRGLAELRGLESGILRTLE